MNSSRPFFCRTWFEFAPRFPPRPFIRRSDMFRIGSRAYRVHSSRNAAKFSTSSISSTHTPFLSIPVLQLNLSSCIFILHRSRILRISRSTSAPFRRICFRMKFTRPRRHSRIFRHLLLTSHGYSSLVRND